VKQANRLAAILKDSSFASEAPIEARSMLAAGLPCAIVAPDSSRKLHALQHKVLDLVLDMLSEMQLQAQQQFPDLNKAYDAKLAELEGVSVLHVLAAADVEEIEQAVEDQSAELEAAEVAWREAAAAEAAQRKMLKAAEKESDAAGKDLGRWTEFEKSTWREVLVEGTAMDTQKHQASVSQAMKEFTRLGAEQTLVACFPNVLRRKPEDRKGFDLEVVTAAEALLSQKLEAAKEAATVSNKLLTEASEQASKAADVLNTAKERVEFCEAKLNEAQATLEVRLQAQRETEKAEGSARIEADSSKSAVDAATERERTLEEAIAYLRELQRQDVVVEKEHSTDAVAEEVEVVEEVEMEEVNPTGDAVP